MSRRSRAKGHLPLVGILLAYAILGAIYALWTPAWQAPDEPAHYNYVRYLVEERRLPVLRMGDYDQTYLEEIKEAKFGPGYSIDAIRYEFHQPLLYYLLLTPVYALSGGALLPLRLASLLVSLGVVATAYFIAREVATLIPRECRPPWLALGTAAFVAFVPQHLATSAAVENDALAELLLGLILLALIRWLRWPQVGSVGRRIWIGVLIALALLTKAGIYTTVPLALIAIWLKFRSGLSWHEGRPMLRPALASAAAFLLPALPISLPWFIRNAVVYGDLDVTGLARHNQVVIGQLRTSEWIAQHGWGSLAGAFLGTTFRSFWAQFGWMAVPIDSRIYLALGLLSGGVALGFVRWLVDNRREKWLASQATILLFSSGLLTLATYLGYNLGFYQAQGRYLFPALIPIALAWSLGLWQSLHRRSARLLTIALGLITAVSGLRLVVGAHDDKWQVLIIGLGFAYWGAAWWLPERWNRWLPLVPYLFLALVCAVSPFWFIAPHLTP